MELGRYELGRYDPVFFELEKNFAVMYRAFAAALETGETKGRPSGMDGKMATQIARQATDDPIRRRMAATN